MFFLSRSLCFGQALRWTLRTVKVRGIPILIGVLLLSAMALLWGMALRTQLFSHEQQQSASSPSVLQNYYEYDVGKVLSGQVVSHAFVFTNTTGELVVVRDEKDIRKDCGCAAVVPEAQKLEPGASTNVNVTVATKGRTGRFSYGGIIAWTLPSGEKREAIFKLQGETWPALECEPSSLGFGPEEINGRVAKEFKFKASVPMNWAKAMVHGYDHDPQIKVVGWKTSENGAVCEVECHMPDGVETANGAVAVEVPLAKPCPDFSSATVRIPVQGRQSVEFTVAPAQILAKVDKADGHASGRLLVRGKKLANSKRPISSITCEGYRVDWRMTEPSTGGVAIVTLELIPVAGSLGNSEPVVVMKVEGMKPIRLPVVKLMVSGK